MTLRLSLLSELLTYSDDVIADRIISCQKHKWACMRFKRDVERMGTENFPWIFDPPIFTDEKTKVKYGPAQRYINWMGLFKHSKGALAGQSKIPCPYEKFVYGNIYGWVHKDTGQRRFRRSYEQIARKNAKSQDKAIQALYEISAFGGGKIEAYIAAIKKEQTRHVWGEAKWLIDHSILKGRFTCKFDQELQQTCIRHIASESFFSRLSQEDKKTGDGACPNFFVIDEYHLHETTEYYDLASSGQKTLENPLLSIISTAGFDLSRPCYNVEYDYVSKVLDPNNPVENERYFVIICEAEKNELSENIEINGKKIAPGELIDDVRSERARLKANPVIGNCKVGKESIEMEINEALDKPEKMRDVLTKTLNIWVNQRDCGYMNMAKWGACGVDVSPEVEKKSVFAGLDLSATIDLTSVAFEIPLPDDIYYVRSHSFMPEESFNRRIKTEKIRFDLWADAGWITVTPGAEVDYHMVFEYILREYERNKWAKGEICFDRALATWLTQELSTAGFTPVEISQSYTGLSAATKDFRGKTYQRKIIHDNDPVLSWAVGNAVTRAGPSENLMLDKAKARQRIDPIAAMLNAHVRAMVMPVTTGGRVLFA